MMVYEPLLNIRKLQRTLFLLMLVVFSLYSCSSKRFVSDMLKDASLGLPIDYKSITANGVWSTGEPGHGLQVSVWCNRDSADYQPNLDLELEGAARVCAALAKNDRLLKWAYLDLIFFNNYQKPDGSLQKISGNAEVILKRDTIKTLREQNAPASEYQKKWRFVQGYKDQPGSKTVLKW
jgi:hypothetical protein